MLALLRMLDKSSLQDTTLLNSLPGTKLLDSKKLLLLFWSPKIGFRYLRSVFLILFALTKNNNDCFQTPDNFGVPAAVYCHCYNNYHTSTWLVGHRRKISALYGFLKSCSWVKTIPVWATLSQGRIYMVLSSLENRHNFPLFLFAHCNAFLRIIKCDKHTMSSLPLKLTVTPDKLRDTWNV